MPVLEIEPLAPDEVERLRRMEIKPCTCKPIWVRDRRTGWRYLVPCEHVLAAHSSRECCHPLSLEEWAAFLLTWKPARKPNRKGKHTEQDYADRPLDAEPARATRRKARVKLLVWRRANGLALWHPDDVNTFPRLVLVTDAEGNEILVREGGC